MEAKELRIGNWINEQGMFIQVGMINSNLFEGSEPIPLTEEILLKAGFEPRDGIQFNPKSLYKTGIGRITLEASKGSDDEWHFDLETNIGLGFNTVVNRPIYLHQLQNLYFALTGTELEIELKV